jgi:hypothetical protein
LNDTSATEEQDQILEGTGSLIFDHDNKVVYAAISPRTDKILVEQLAKDLGYSPVCFEAYGKENELIYHTNVMMCVGHSFIIAGLDTIKKEGRELVLDSIKSSGKEIIELTNEQVYNHFAGNMLQLINKNGEHVLVMSKDAFINLENDQKERLSSLNDRIVTAEIPTIESVGGGSARCMLAELFEPKL